MNKPTKKDLGLKYNNAKKMDKNFLYQDLKRSNCFNTDFSKSNFNFTSLRGAHLKSCNFYGCSFDSTEFIGSNLKKSKFTKAKFENAIFDSVNLESVDFDRATFKNTIFVNTDVSKATNFKFDANEVTILDEMPKLEISERLEQAILSAMNNKFIKSSRTLDTKDGSINPISVQILLSHFKERHLIDGLILLGERLDKDFCTLSYIIKALNTYSRQGLL